MYMARELVVYTHGRQNPSIRQINAMAANELVTK